MNLVRGVVASVFLLLICVSTAICCYATDSVTQATPVILIEEDFSIEMGNSRPILYNIASEIDPDSITWTSSNSTVASVLDGTVIAKLEGQTEITVTGLWTPTAEEDADADEDETVEPIEVTASVLVTVYVVQPTQIVVDQDSILVEMIGQGSIDAYVLPYNATDPSLRMSIADESIAVFDDEGIIQPVSVGKTSILIEASNGIVKTVSLEVFEVVATDVTLTADDDVTYNDGNYYAKPESIVYLTASITPSNVTYSDLIWESSDESVAIVQDGKVEFLKQGDVVITCTTNNGIQTSMEFEVYDPTGTVMIIMAGALVLLLSFFMWNKYRDRKRIKQLLAETKLILPTVEQNEQNEQSEPE